MGKFVKFTDKSGEMRFNLKADNGEVILRSQGYKSKAALENGIDSVRTNCGKGDNYEVKNTTDGRCYFNLKAANSQVIGTSQMYKGKSGCDNGIDSVKKNGKSKEEQEL